MIFLWSLPSQTNISYDNQCHGTNWHVNLNISKCEQITLNILWNWEMFECSLLKHLSDFMIHRSKQDFIIVLIIILRVVGAVGVIKIGKGSFPLHIMADLKNYQKVCFKIRLSTYAKLGKNRGILKPSWAFIKTKINYSIYQ